LMDNYTPVADVRAVHEPDSIFTKCVNENYRINYHRYKTFCA